MSVALGQLNLFRPSPTGANNVEANHRCGLLAGLPPGRSTTGQRNVADVIFLPVSRSFH